GVFDVLHIKKSDAISVRCADIENENNIAFRAAKEFFWFTGIKGGADIKIEKNIPVCSGLGGGHIRAR
ncbi:MAG: 4-(cytidine 5'-diphospho)-2-C-methyl-D-erythritol kinase, partial [Clostridia bacterium]|nr:4-(cytidine 5'-diphospho)-2-C-methyl-D-erythritol kinase [Clostridia bacterium]